MTLNTLRTQIIKHPSNAWAKKKGWEPIYTAHKKARVVLIGQAPGIRAQESGIPWNDPSGENLRSWLGIDRNTFYDETKFALVPMDFYFPGGQERGDLPPRSDFAPRWHPEILAAMPEHTLTILIGQYAQKYYLGKERGKTLTQTVQQAAEYLPTYFPLVHPSPRNNIWQKKNPWFMEETIPLLRKQVARALK